MGSVEGKALVCGADDPLDNRRVRFPHCVMRILVEGDPPIYTAARFKFDHGHWPVRGMELPVTIDPNSPEDFEVEWDEVPSIAERVAANDPSLADPIGAHRRVVKALISAGVAGKGVPAPERASVRDLARQALKGAFKRGHGQVEVDQDEFLFSLHSDAQLIDEGDASAVVGHFDESMEKLAAMEAPSGKQRAGVLFSAHAATLESQGASGPSGAGATSYFERHGKHEVVLSVHVPGQDPYAVHVEKFDHKKGKAADFMSVLPALVSITDPNDVEVTWDDLLSSKQYKKQRQAEAMAEVAEHRAKILNPGLQEPGGAPVGPAEVYKQAARKALATTQGPGRQMAIEQYRKLGVEISDDGEVKD
jgi:hypothetical protein